VAANREAVIRMSDEDENRYEVTIVRYCHTTVVAESEEEAKEEAEWDDHTAGEDERRAAKL
jgi:hypothetical protein